LEGYEQAQTQAESCSTGKGGGAGRSERRRRAGDEIIITPRVEQQDSLTGKWVVADSGSVGVVAKLLEGGLVELHTIGAEGLTERALVVRAETLSATDWQ
jgi:hypothetical protein